jgi:hypothetical protein
MEFGSFEAALQASVVAVSAFVVDEQAEAILEGQVGILGLVELLFESGTESGQVELGQFVEQRLSQQG